MNIELFKNNYEAEYKGVNLYFDHVSSRLKIISFSEIDLHIISEIIQMARQEKIGKVIGISPKKFLNEFKSAGFFIEAMIEGFFKGNDAYCVAYCIEDERCNQVNKAKQDEIIEKCLKINDEFIPGIDSEFIIRDAKEEDIPQIIDLFLYTFETYPLPVYDSNFLKEVIGTRFLFKVAIKDGKVASMASADMDKTNFCAEITDCATYPEHRGKKLIPNLIYCIEQELKDRGFYSLYSFARASQFGINKILHTLGYKYAGRQIQDCNLCATLEDTNVWVKKIR